MLLPDTFIVAFMHKRPALQDINSGQLTPRGCSSGKSLGLDGMLPPGLRFRTHRCKQFLGAISLGEFPLKLPEVHLWETPSWELVHVTLHPSKVCKARGTRCY